jgi:hypothetical protein
MENSKVAKRMGHGAASKETGRSDGHCRGDGRSRVCWSGGNGEGAAKLSEVGSDDGWMVEAR